MSCSCARVMVNVQIASKLMINLYLNLVGFSNHFIEKDLIWRMHGAFYATGYSSARIVNSFTFHLNRSENKK